MGFVAGNHTNIANIISSTQNHMNKLTNSFFKWRIKIFSEETESIIFTMRKLQQLTLNNSDIQYKEKVKYLCIVLDKKLIFKDHTKYITSETKNKTHIRTLSSPHNHSHGNRKTRLH